MPPLATFKPVKTEKGWRLNVPATLSETKKRQQLFFPTREKALQHASRLRENREKHGTASTNLSPGVAEDAARAWAILEPLGVSLTAAANEVAARLGSRVGSVKLEKAAEAWEATWGGRIRAKTEKSYKATVGLLLKPHADTLLCDITSADIDAAISGASKSLHHRNASAFLRWCSKPPRRWCDAGKLLEGVESPSRKRDGEIEVMRPAEAKALLTVAKKHFPETVCMYAVALFAGMRKEELSKLTKDAVNSDGINVTAAIAKKGRRRFIPLSDTLKAWLTAYPFTPCPNWIDKDKAVRRLAGWDVASRLVDSPPPVTRGTWPRNALRHTHASAEIASGAKLEDLLFRFGHTDSPAMLRAHYVGRYSPDEAAAFLALRP